MFERVGEFLPGVQTIVVKGVSHSCEKFEQATDDAECAMCNTLSRVGLYRGHKDLEDRVDVQELVRTVFLEVLQEQDHITCPFKENEPCTLLKRKKRPPSAK